MSPKNRRQAEIPKLVMTAVFCQVLTKREATPWWRWRERRELLRQLRAFYPQMAAEVAEFTKAMGGAPRMEIRREDV